MYPSNGVGMDLDLDGAWNSDRQELNENPVPSARSFSLPYTLLFIFVIE
jgi:hypothetical protein